MRNPVKPRHTAVSNRFHSLVSVVLIGVLAVQPALLSAQTITQAGGQIGSGSHVDAAANGTPVLNIGKPNSAGVSHDIYTGFKADDLILNNAATSTNTRLGGWIEGNPNLRPGKEADVWIGEVVGGNQTQLNGILEVGGKTMDVVLANEFGITCNGCGFVNTGRTTLTTGKPVFAGNGGLDGFDVRQGAVIIGANGLNPESRLAFADTSRVDVIGRAAVLYGKMRAEEVGIVTGANKVDYDWSYNPETGQVTGVTEQSGVGPAPALAVDVAALGGMYANAIRMVATEDGVGVRMNGEMASSTDISLRADGQLSMGAPSAGSTPLIKARKNVKIRNHGPLLLEGIIASETGADVDIRTDQGDLVFTGEVAGGAVTLEAAGLSTIAGALVARQSLRIASKTSDVVMDQAARIAAEATEVQAAKDVILDATVGVNNGFRITAGDELRTGALSSLSGANLTFRADQVTLAGIATGSTRLAVEAFSGALENTGTLSGRNIALTGPTVKNTGTVLAFDQAQVTTSVGALENTGTLGAGDDLNLSAAMQLQNKGVLRGGKIDFESVTALEFDATSTITGDTLRFVAPTIHNAGTLAADNSLTLVSRVGDLNNKGVLSGDTVALVSKIDIENTGQIVGQTQAQLSAEGTVLNASAGRISARGIALQGTTVTNDGALSGTVIAGTATGVLRNTGQIAASGLVKLDAATLQQSGTIAGLDVAFDAADIANDASGDVQGTRDVVLTAANTFTNGGQILASEVLNVTSGAGGFTNAGTINGRVLNIDTSGSVTINAGGRLIGQTSLDLKAGALSAGGTSSLKQLRSGGVLRLKLLNQGLSVGQGDQVVAGGNLYLDLGGNLTSQGLIQAAGDLVLTSQGHLTNNQGVFKSGADMRLTAAGDITNISGLIEADGNMELSAQNVVNRYVSATVANLDGSVGRMVGRHTFMETVCRDGDCDLRPTSRDIDQTVGMVGSFAAGCPLASGQCSLSGAPTLEGEGTVYWSVGDDITTVGATPNIVSGQNLQITGNVRNQAGVFSARGDVSVTASSLFNTSYRDTVRRASADYISRDRTCVDADFCGFANEREQRYSFEDFRDRGPAPGNTTLTGKILGGGDVSIIATTSSSSGTIAAGSSQTLAPQITDLSAGGANLPALQLTADPGAVTIADLVAVPDVTLAGSVANLTVVQPQLSATPSIATLIGKGQSTFDETDPGFADYASFLTAIYTSDLQLLQRQSDVVVQQEITSDPGPSFSFGDRTLGLQDLVDLYDGAAGVQVPERLLLTPELLALALQGNSAAQPELAPVSPRGPPSGNLSITAFSIIGSGGQFTANGGNVTLEALGPISLSGTALDGIDIRIVAGTDFTGRGLLINAVNDLSITAVQGDVELLEIVEDYQTFARRGTGIETGTRVTQTALNVGGDLTIQSGRDTILSAVTAQIGGDTTLTAGRDLSILAAQEFFEEKGRSGSKRYEKTAVMSIVSDLNTSGGLIATAGRNATLVGAQIAAGRDTSITAGRDLVLAAAQDVEQGSSRSKKSGFLSSKTTTESYLNITNRGVSITSGGDIALQADTGDLTTAGSRFNARGGDVALTATQGDVLVGSYTDTRQRSKTVKKSILGGLLGGTDHKTRIDQIGSGTDALAALDLSVVSGANTTLIGAQLEAGQRLSIRTGGDLSVQGALSSTRKDRYSNNSGLVVSTTITERSFREAVALTSLLAGGALDLDVGGRTELVLYALEGTDAPRPEDVYPQELLALQGLSLLNQELADEYFYEKETTLSPAFKALVAVALSSTGVGAQMGASLLGTVSPGAVSTAFTVNASGIVSVAQGSALGAASTAFASSLALDTLDAVVSGNFDVADILESAVFSGATAGLTSGINIEDLGIELGRSGGDIIAGFGSGQFTIEGLLDSTLDGVITSGLSSAVYGTDFGEGLLSSVVTYVADGIAGGAIEEVADVYGHDRSSLEKLVAKATINCIAAEAKGASCGAGALGSLVTELMTAQAGKNGPLTGDDLTRLEQDIELVAALAGYFASGGEAVNVNAAVRAAELDVDNNWVWLVVRGGLFAWSVYEVAEAGVALDAMFDRMSADGTLSAAEAQELQEAAAAVGITIAFEVTAGKVVEGLRIASIAGDFSVAVAKRLGLDKTLADLNAKFGLVGTSNRGADGFYDPQKWRQNYDDFYSGNVTSTTVPPYSAKNVQLAGQRHPETGVVFDQRGFPIFDNYSAYDTRFTGVDFQNANYQTQMRMATRDLRSQILANPQLRSQFNGAQLSAIQSGNAKIPDFTWHHHQDQGRMQLVRENIHRRTGHIGGEAMSGGQ